MVVRSVVLVMCACDLFRMHMNWFIGPRHHRTSVATTYDLPSNLPEGVSEI